MGGDKDDDADDGDDDDDDDCDDEDWRNEMYLPVSEGEPDKSTALPNGSPRASRASCGGLGGGGGGLFQTVDIS